MLSKLWDLASVPRARSVTPENPTGRPGQGGLATTGTGAKAARELGQGWKVSPSVVVPAGRSVDLAAVAGPGAVKHLWLTTTAHGREMVLRAHWDGSAEPGVEVPLGDFFCNGWGSFAPVSSVPVVVAPYKAMSCYWEMPFKQAARISVENLSRRDAVVYYQVDYVEMDVPAGAGYFHATWRRDNPVSESGVHELLDCSAGPGVYCGTYLAVGVNGPGWWGEGELKFYLDDDTAGATICGTGTEDYFGGAWDFDVPGAGYSPFCAPFFGLCQVIKPDGLYASQQRFGMYRWHVLDPVGFERRLRVTAQDLGWHADGRYLKRRDDISSMAVWYDASPAGVSRPPISADEMEVSSRPERTA